jgi:DNA (cytosine-5)-methyltransferase 1
MKQITALYIDLFCGAGGTSSGVEYARLDGRKCAEVVACVNHDANAIRSHKANHPHTLHFTEDIRTLELSPMVKHLEKKRRQYPKAKVVLWASLECTNFSKAKGGQPRDADSRTLADHLFRYIEALQPDYIQIENVEEFMCWGALDENGKPVSRDQGSDYLRWVRQVQGYGYDFDWRVLNAADFGAYTSRKRFFGLFARKGLPIAFPEQTYAKNGDEGGMFHQYRRWRAVREVLDLDDDGESIFVRRKPLCEKTLERIYAGLVKFVAGGKKQHEAWILKYNSMNQQNHHNAPSIDEPCPTVACQNRLGLVKCQFLSKQFSGDPDSKNIDIEQPAGTVTTIDHHAFVTAYHGGCNRNYSIDDPCATITTKDKLAMVTTKFMDNQYGKSKPTSIDGPAPTLVNNPKQKIVTCKPWVMSTDFNNVGSSVDGPAPVITACHKYHYLMNPQFASAGGSVENPCFTLIARMDKMPPYLITTKEGAVGIAIYESDSPWTRKVKEFMAAYGIVDICMRMLNIGELKRIMGFPTDYVLIGTQAEQKKYIGNAVEVNMSRVLCEALCRKIKSMNK